MSYSLKKGEKISLKKEDDKLSEFHVGLGWDTNIDLDSIAYLLNAEGKAIRVVSFRNLSVRGVRLHGDNLTGEGDGDDEVISINLNEIDSEVKKIALYANIFSPGEGLFKKTFVKVKGAFIRIENEKTKQEICKYQISDLNKRCTAFHFGDLNVEDGTFEAIGEPADGSIEQIKKKYYS